jgi:hypothetical protein
LATTFVLTSSSQCPDKCSSRYAESSAIGAGQQDEMTIGRAAFLPTTVPEHHALRKTSRLHPGAFNHPVIITGADSQKGLVQFSVCTSYNCREITNAVQNKASRAHFRMIFQPGNPRVSHDGFDALDIESDGGFGPFRKKTYVRASERFWIEKEYLTPFETRGHRRVQLTPGAQKELDAVYASYEQQSSNKISRPGNRI